MIKKKWSLKYDQCISCKSNDTPHKGKGLCVRCYRKQNPPPSGLCSKCAQTKLLRHLDSEGNRICSKCYNEIYNTILCSHCNNFGIKSLRLDDGSLICRNCYTKFYRPKKTCFVCNQEKTVHKKDGDKNICSSCYEKYYKPKKKCSECGKVAKVHKKIDNLNICSTCYSSHYRPKRQCSICGNISMIEKKEGDKDICVNCYAKHYVPKRLCYLCNTVKKIHAIIEGKDICKCCYDINYRPKRKCSICGEISKISIAENYIDICIKCYEKHYRPKRVCSICGNLERIEKVDAGNDICFRCYNKSFKPKKECSICKIKKTTHMVINEESVCNTCYQKYYQPKRVCSLCNLKRKIALTKDSNDICYICYSKLEGTCEKCNTKTSNFFHSANVCDNCWYTNKINQFLMKNKYSFYSNDLSNLFIEYVNTLLRYRKPITVYVTILNQYDIFYYIDKHNILNNNKIYYSQLEDIKAYLNIYNTSQLENFLLKKNILIPLSQYEIFSNNQLKYSNQLHTNFQNTFISYAKYLLDIKKCYEDKGHMDRFSWKTCNNYLYVSFSFLKFASTKTKTIYEVSDMIINEFCKDLQWLIGPIRHLVNWLNTNVKLFKKLRLPKPIKTSIGGNPYSEEDFIYIINSLSKPTTPYREKLMGFLLLIYAIRPKEFIKLTLDDINHTENGSYIYVRNTWISMHPFIVDILNAYLKLERTINLSLGSKYNFLFQGEKYDSPISLHYAYELLKKHDINSIRAFSTAITNSLTTEITHPAVLIQGLGISISTVVRYYKSLNIENRYEINSSTINCENSSISSANNSDKEMFYTYILKCNDGSYYTGFTSNLENRIANHDNGIGSKYTKTRRPVKLIFYEIFDDKSLALKREKQIKKLTVYEKEQLIKKSRRE